MEINIRNLSKSFKDKKALNNISVDIKQGMYGLLGRNGAGKTTLMRILSTLLTKDSGSIKIDGIGIENSNDIRKMIGYLPQEFSIYNTLTVYEVMEYLALLSNVNVKMIDSRIDTLLKKVNLYDCKKAKVKSLSGGMKRRLGIAQALLHDPQVLIVDEPTAGLDAEERIRFRNLLCDLAEDKIVILSTHIVGDIESTCENIGILDSGRLIFNGTASELKNKAENHIFSMKVTRKEYENIRNKFKIISVVTSGEFLDVRLICDKNPEDKMTPVEPDIEDAYIYVIGGDVNV